MSDLEQKLHEVIQPLLEEGFFLVNDYNPAGPIATVLLGNNDRATNNNGGRCLRGLLAETFGAVSLSTIASGLGVDPEVVRILEAGFEGWTHPGYEPNSETYAIGVRIREAYNA